MPTGTMARTPPALDASVSRPGPLALAGSGEFLPVMREADVYLIDQVGGPREARVAVIPTASGLEPGMPGKWASMGVEHFRALGVAVDAVMIETRSDVDDPRWLALLEQANFYYFSGGNPRHVIDTYRGSRAWEIVTARHRAGAVLAGCSAGAMMLGGATIRVRDVVAGRPPVWEPALGLVPRFATIPHFDRITRFVDEALLAQIISVCRTDLTILGIDEDTVLVRTAPRGGTPDTEPRWTVMGRQSVTIVQAANPRQRTAFPAGARIDIDEGPPSHLPAEKDSTLR